MSGHATPHALPLLTHLSAGRARRLLAASSPHRFAQGDTLFRQGEAADAIWVIQEGWVHLVRGAKETDGTRRVVIFTITPAEVLCGLSAVAPGSRYHASAVAATACRARCLPAPLFREALTHEPAFAAHVVQLCVRRIQHIAQQYGSMAEPVSHRIVRAILRLADQFGEAIPLTHRELAQMAWTTTESAIRTVRRLKEQGYVSGERGRLVLAQRAALERLLTAAPSYDGGHRPAARVRIPLRRSGARDGTQPGGASR